MSKDTRFEVNEKEATALSSSQVKVIVDKETFFMMDMRAV